MIEIKNRFSGVVIYASEKANIKEAVEEAVALKINLSSSNLSYSNLRSSDLRDIKNDVFAVLDCAPSEVRGVLDLLNEGRIHGTVYAGDCACLCGSIAKLQHCDYKSIPGLPIDSSRPAERWFLGILQGHTPANSQIAKITAEWIQEWLDKRVAGVEVL